MRSDPVDDEDALELVLEPELAGGDGHRVEEAEAHRLLRLGVVARRTDHGEPVLDLARDGCVTKQFVRCAFKTKYTFEFFSLVFSSLDATAHCHPGHTVRIH